MQQTTPPRLHFRVPPEPSHLLRARERLRDYLRQYCTDRDVVDDIVVCVEEACTNAIRHGGSPDDIEIALHFTHTRLIATVKDHGRGFDVASFDPKVSPDPTSDRGRGLFIIAALMDDLGLRVDGGLEVRMARKAEPRCEPAPLDSGLGERVAGTLGHREARTRATLEQIDEGFVALDWEYRYLYVNEPACRLLERSRDELLGHKLFALFARLRGTELDSGFRAAMELGGPSVLEWRSPVIGGWVEVRVYPTPAGVTAYFHDITERKRVEEEREQLIEQLSRGNEREMRAARTAETLSKVNEILLSALTLDDVVERLVGEASEAAGADKSLVIHVGDDGSFTITHVRNVRKDLVEQAQGRRILPGLCPCCRSEVPHSDRRQLDRRAPQQGLRRLLRPARLSAAAAHRRRQSQSRPRPLLRRSPSLRRRRLPRRRAHGRGDVAGAPQRLPLRGGTGSRRGPAAPSRAARPLL